MGSEIAQACFFLSSLAHLCESGFTYESDREKARQYVEMILNLLTHGSEVQLKAALGNDA